MKKVFNILLAIMMVALCAFSFTACKKIEGTGEKEKGLLIKKIGEVYTRDELGDVLGVAENLRTVDVQITRLRKKIEKDTKNPRYLQTVRGKGYMLISE